ncbi:MAG: MotA/TolQ/ExbB proton channel family protein [Bacteroidaceae bacterium]
MTDILTFIKENPTAVISSVVIIGVFLYFLFETSKIEICRRIIDKALKSDDPLAELGNTKLSKLKDEYLKNLTIKTDDGLKTNVPSSEIFSEQTTSKKMHWNMRMLDAASGTLVGLGLLGTFLGLTLGITGFDNSSSEKINESIKLLLSGMGTAFLTSLIGMFLSLVYTVVIEKPWKNKLAKSLYFFTEDLDKKYYIDDITLMNLNQKNLFDDLRNSILDSIEKQFSYTNETGQKIEVSNAIREILKENEEQSKALKSFSTDLALELNNGFDEVMSRQMQEKLLPLMENIDGTTKAVIEHIDLMAANVASPATDMIQNVVDELKNSMTSIMQEFKNNLSGDATNELEELAKSLGTATQAMANFPKNMENISATLQVTIEEVKNAISEISNTSAVSNNTAMQKMQEQITFATTSISNTIAEVKDVMSTLTQSSEQSSQEMISKLAVASEQMGQFLSNTLGQLSLSVKNSIQGITEEVANKHSDLLALQEDTVGETEKLLNTFNQGLERMERMNEYITGTMDMFQKAQGEIAGSTAHLTTITDDMKVATEVFNKTQNDYTGSMTNIQQMSQRNIDAITQLIKNSGDMSDDYVKKFETIRSGLSSIFGQIQTGLNEYSKTVQTTTQKYLDQYSTSLTNTTDALSSTIQQQNEVVEMLVESLNSNKK